MRIFAQQTTGTSLGRLGGEQGLGPFGNISLSQEAGLAGITNLVSSVVGFMTVAAAIWFLFNILYGGYEWLTSGGDAKKLASARDHITHAFIGLIIVVGAWTLLAVAGQFFGYNILIDPAEVTRQLQIQAP